MGTSLRAPIVDFSDREPPYGLVAMARVRLRWRLFSAAFGLVAIGLPSRLGIEGAPGWYVDYAGDALWAAMVYFGLLFLAPRWSRAQGAGSALGFAYLIELSQLAHPEWLDRLRATFPFGLVLGYEFLWTDLIAYSVGVAVAVALDGRWLDQAAGARPQSS